MNINILSEAKDDLISGFWFYEDRESGLGDYFKTCLYSDIESLKFTAGIHPTPYKELHRALSDRFPFAIYYKIENDTILIRAILDCRRSDEWVAKRLD